MIAILLFIGAMGKSAQVPLHVWLPDSMEGPTPISALIHAATMVTAGIFMVARFSPVFELSDAALSFILVIGAVTAIFMGLLGIVQHDIKRVIAYSTLSQLGFMTAALGVSAYSPALVPPDDPCLLQGAAVPRGRFGDHRLHHQQDMRQWAVSRKSCRSPSPPSSSGRWPDRLPGYVRLLLQGVDHLCRAASELPGAEFAYWALFIGVFVTAFYTFRMLFLVFFGEPRMDKHTARTSRVAQRS